ncbi:hypothetical protein J6E39_06210 [bacterium]|nr:hypothetical protein [bacterium]
MIKNTKSALSPVGIAIAIVCLLGLVMILSTPVIVDKYQHKNAANVNIEPENQNIINDLSMKITELEQRINEVDNNARNIEQNLRIQSPSARSARSENSYSCTIEGVVDENGNMISASQVKSTTPETKYVFVCSKR